MAAYADLVMARARNAAAWSRGNYHRSRRSYHILIARRVIIATRSRQAANINGNAVSWRNGNNAIKLL